MSNVLYLIQSEDIVISESLAAGVLHDVPGDVDGMRLKALVASGDFFETLAARLEQIAAALPQTSMEQFQLQDAVGQLLALQRDYVIAKKPASTRP